MANNNSEIQEGLDEYEDEKKEVKETKNKSRNVSSLFGSIVEDFVGEKLDDNIDFFDEEQIKKDKNYENIKNFLYEGTDYEDYTSDFNNLSDTQKKELLEKVRKEIIKQKIGIDKNIATAKKIIDNEYKISNKELLDKKLKEVYNSKDGRKKITNIIKTHSVRFGFLNKNLKNNFEEKENLNVNEDENLEKIEGLDIEKLNSDQISLLTKFYKSQMTIEVDEFVRLLGFIDKKNRQAILKHFNPSISLEDLIKNDIISQDKAIEILTNSFNNSSLKASKKELKEILKKQDFKDIFIDLDDLEENEIRKYLEKPDAVKPFLEEINKARREYEKDSTKRFYDYDLLDFDDEGNIHNNFIDFIRNSTKEISSETITSINKFNKGNYIKVNDGKNDVYYYIDEIDKGGTKSGKHILIKNLYSPTGVRKQENVLNEMMTYEELYKLLKIIDQSKGQSIDFLSEDDFNKEEKKEAIEENNIQTEAQLKDILYKKGLIEDDARKLNFTELTFKDGKKNQEFFRSFSKTDDSRHSIIFEGSGQEITYSDFYDEFVKGKYKLEKKINGTELSEKSEFLKKHNLIIDGNKIINKDDTDKKAVTKIIGDDYVIKIKSVNNDNIEYIVGKIKNTNQIIEKEKYIDKKTGKTKEKKVEKGIRYDLENEILSNSFNDFLLELDNNKKGYQLASENTFINEDENAKPLERKSTFMGKVFTLSSMAEVLQGGTMVIDAVKGYFERGNDLRAAKFANIFGSILPEDVQAKLRFNLTEKKKETIEKIFKELTEDDGGPAMKRIIERILKNKNAMSEEIFAAMKFLMIKRGSLYAKEELLKYKNDFIWYQALGGKKGDSFYKRYKAEIEVQNNEKNNASGKPDPIPFTEEGLIEAYLKTYQKETNSLYPRVEKDFGGYIKEGQENRFKKGNDEAGNKYSISEKIKYFGENLKDGEKSRALGAVDKIIQKNSSYESIYMPGFIISMSGISDSFNGIELNKLIGFAYETPSTAFLFSLDKNGIETYQNALINYYTQTNNNEKAKKLKKILSSNIDKRIESLINFWLENKDEIIDFYNFENPYILLNKGTSKDIGGYYQKIFETYKGSLASSEYNIEQNKFLLEGQFNKTALVDTANKLTKIEGLNTGAYKSSVSRKVTNLYFERLEKIKKLSISNDEKKILFNNFYYNLQARISNTLGTYSDSKTVYKGEIVKDFKKHNLLIKEIDGYENLNKNEFLDIAFENFINNDIKDEDGDPTISNITEEIPNSINKLLEDKPINNIDYYPEEKVA